MNKRVFITPQFASIPVIDIFAGPGGLGEGFSEYHNEFHEPCFNVTLSIEREEYAHKTLRLRSFFRQFDKNLVPDDYYKFLGNEITEADLYSLYPTQAEASSSQAWKAELGVTSAAAIDRKIRISRGDTQEWILLGGPPCQAYSVIGRSRYSKIWREHPNKRDEDNRHYLYREYLRILAVHQPPVFVLENVRGLLSSTVSTGKIADKIFEDLKNPCQALDNTHNEEKRKGYRLFSVVREPRAFKFVDEPEFLPEDFIIRCERYGIPQARHRVIIFGIRDDINLQPELLEQQENIVAVEKVISDLPKIRSGISKGTDSIQNWVCIIKQMQSNGILSDPIISEAVKEEIQNQIINLPDNLNRGGESIIMDCSPVPRALKEWLYDANLKGVVNHSSRGHMPTDLQRYFFGICFASVNGYSPKLSDFPKALLPNHKNIINGVKGVQFSDRFRVQLSSKPSTTITSHISKDGHYYIHPDPTQCRSLTVREAARLQTFPDNYYFMGPRTSQYHQVGNAVPPLLAHQLAEKVYKLLQNNRNKSAKVTDRISKEHRSWNMSRIRSKDTEPELAVRSALHKMGYSFRLNKKDLPGKPDIVLSKYRTVIFVHGCFWHRHDNCKFAYSPKSRTDFWEAKFARNIQRHGEVTRQLENLGWRVITVWECELANISKLQEAFSKWLPRKG